MSDVSNHKFAVCVIGGGGHIGLPLGVACARRGMKTALLDINAEVLAKIQSGIFPFKEEQGEEQLRQALAENQLSTSTDPAVIADSRFIILVIGTPIDEYLNPSFNGILRAIDNYFPHFRDDQIVILRSTVYPGTSERLQEYFSRRGKRVHISFCPERVVEGKALSEIGSLPQLVSAFDEETLSAVTKFFATVTTGKVIPVQPIEAELAKLFCNAWRYIQFSVANQFYMTAANYNLNYDRIYQAMAEDYPRAQALPSPGFAAGPCLLKDTMQLAAFTNNSFYLGHAAMLVNEGLPNFLIQRLKQQQRTLKDKKIGILGMTFKADSDDIRDSLSFKLRKIADMEAKQVLCHDFYLDNTNFSLSPLETVLTAADIIILATPHERYNHIDPAKYPGKMFVDLWNFWGKGPEIKT